VKLRAGTSGRNGIPPTDRRGGSFIEARNATFDNALESPDIKR
jgi:hypothetical protein